MNIMNGIIYIYLSQADAVCINITVHTVLGPDRRRPAKDISLNTEDVPKVQNTDVAIKTAQHKRVNEWQRKQVIALIRGRHSTSYHR